MERFEIIQWKKTYGLDLQIGSEVQVKPSSKYYDIKYDQDLAYMVTYLYVDDEGLNIGINDGGIKRWSCDTDGYRIQDLEPAL